MERQGGSQRARPMSLGGVDHHTRWLVDHDQLIVFKNDVQRDVFRFLDVAGFGGKFELDLLIRFQPRRGFCNFAIDDDVASCHGTLNLCPAELWKVLYEESVQPQVFLLELDRPALPLPVYWRLRVKHLIVVFVAWFHASDCTSVDVPVGDRFRHGYHFGRGKHGFNCSNWKLMAESIRKCETFVFC